MNYQHILDRLPYKSSFRFVDEITDLGPDRVVGQYTLRPDAYFFEDHFPGYPVTPGAILTEIMVQIGLVVLGIYLMTTEAEVALRAAVSAGAPAPVFPLLTSADVSFLKMVLPGQRVTVVSTKVYYKFEKLKCKVEMQDEKGEVIAKGVFAGMIKQLTK